MKVLSWGFISGETSWSKSRVSYTTIFPGVEPQFQHGGGRNKFPTLHRRWKDRLRLRLTLDLVRGLARM
ncbi:hypothetical protein JTE90_017423 [Oedothorax gibbosus]|uniref:Uncharacterized protein n=1 Tax=Oedothorax gibbosus TaxID=931172 RepID=A0AAV6U8D4_9ARAC|nr:hypothetical protein JTE90_017423 [Oedothorax gibbosus]